MAVLSSEDRARVHRGLMRHLSFRADDLPCAGFTKAHLRTAIDATDEWIEANQASYIAALPEPFKAASPPALKVLLFCAVAVMRVSVEFARSVFGEVD